jgi:flagellar brake protein
MITLESALANDISPYTTTDPLEIVGILSALRDRHARASVYFNAQPGSILTSILAVNAAEGRFVFDLDSNPRRNEALLSGHRLAWQTSVDGVKIEFNTEAARRTIHVDGPAMDVALPQSVLRLQRRNAFRTETPTARPIICLIDPEGQGDREVRARILDISALGVSILIDTMELAVTDGQRLARLTMELPGFGEVQCGAEIRYTIDAGKRFGSTFRRCGAQFKELASADQVLVQRYIINLERERAKSRNDDN